MRKSLNTCFHELPTFLKRTNYCNRTTRSIAQSTLHSKQTNIPSHGCRIRRKSSKISISGCLTSRVRSLRPRQSRSLTHSRTQTMTNRSSSTKGVRTQTNASTSAKARKGSYGRARESLTKTYQNAGRGAGPRGGRKGSAGFLQGV